MEKTTEFKVIKTGIPGLLEIDVSFIEDSRGWFQEKFQKEKLVAAGLPDSFMPVQQNITFNKKAGTIRGIHAEPWDKYISVIMGIAHGVFVDLRSGKNFGKKVEIVLDSAKAVFVPRGVGNSFQTMEDNTYYQYFVNQHWSADGQYVSVNVADPDLAINWPISLDKAIISEKDRKHPMLNDIKPFDILDS